MEEKTMEQKGHANGKRTAGAHEFQSKRSTQGKSPREKNYKFLSTVWFILQCLLCHILLLVGLVPLLPFMIILFIFKIVERILVKMTSGDVALTGVDAAWATHNEKNPIVIDVLHCVENKDGIEEGVNSFRQAILERLVNAKKDNGKLLYPRVRCCIRPGWFQYFFQEDHSFKIENHVFKWQGEVPRTKDELAAIISKLSGESFPEERPPWYYCCVPTNFGDKDIAVVFRIHHSIADGISIVKYHTHNLPDQAAPQAAPPKSSSMSWFLFLAKGLLISPRYLLYWLMSDADQSLLHGPNLSGIKKVAWDEAFELRLIKEIKAVTGVTVNDVLTTCFSMALRRYFRSKGAENPVDFTALVAVDVRSPRSSSELAFENKFTFNLCKLPVATEGAVKQLCETKHRMGEIKLSGSSLGVAYLIIFLCELLPEFVTSKLGTFLARKASCVLSNVAGPQFIYTIKGNHLKYSAFWPPTKDNVGVVLSVYTCAGQVIVGVKGDVSVLPDPGLIVKEFRNAVNEIARCVFDKAGSDSNGQTD